MIQRIILIMPGESFSFLAEGRGTEALEAAALRLHRDYGIAYEDMDRALVSPDITSNEFNIADRPELHDTYIWNERWRQVGSSKVSHILGTPVNYAIKYPITGFFCLRD